MKCRLHKCHAACCHNIPFEAGELERFADKTVNRVLFTMPLGPGTVAFTDEDPMKNKCPFLRADCKCNIYDDRPRICRLFGEIDKLRCKWRKG